MAKHFRAPSPGFAIRAIAILAMSLLAYSSASACTIFSGVAANGEVWNGNNEDGRLGVATYINVFPKGSSSRFGFYSLSYGSPKNGANGNMQGGMNEAGLTFDFNALEHSYAVVGKDSKKVFPRGDSAILRHVLENYETVEEVVAFFDEYWFKNGFTSAQMHLADRFGHFAIVSPSGSRVLTDRKFQVSTNFRACGGTKEEAEVCWRFPIATEKLIRNGSSLNSFTDIAQSTAQNSNGDGTLYSNIQNLNTGDIWFFFAQDFRLPFKTSMRELLSLGKRSYLMEDLQGRRGFADGKSAGAAR
jgi:hypothetical protein